jgi:hypothetical protein
MPTLPQNRSTQSAGLPMGVTNWHSSNLETMALPWTLLNERRLSKSSIKHNVHCSSFTFTELPVQLARRGFSMR